MARPIVLSLTGLSSSSGYPLWMPDLYKAPFSVSVSMFPSPSSASGQTASLEVTNDYQGNLSSHFSGWISSAAHWSAAIANISSAQGGVITTPFTACRLNVTGGSSSGGFIAELVQAG